MKDYCSRETAEALKRLGLDQKGYMNYYLIPCPKMLVPDIHMVNEGFIDWTWDCGCRWYAALSAGEALDKLKELALQSDDLPGYFARIEDVVSNWLRSPIPSELADVLCLLLSDMLEEGILE